MAKEKEENNSKKAPASNAPVTSKKSAESKKSETKKNAESKKLVPKKSEFAVGS